jgi:hypothetical protein
MISFMPFWYLLAILISFFSFHNTCLSESIRQVFSVMVGLEYASGTITGRWYVSRPCRQACDSWGVILHWGQARAGTVLGGSQCLPLGEGDYERWRMCENGLRWRVCAVIVASVRQGCYGPCTVVYYEIYDMASWWSICTVIDWWQKKCHDALETWW